MGLRSSVYIALVVSGLSLGLAAVGAGEASAAGMRLHQCVTTRITLLGSRLEGAPDSGSFVKYANGVPGVSYEREPALRRSRVGDPVRLCLTSLPKDCPKGDERGKMYAATNLRTGARWELPDAEHMCGGA